MDNISNRKKLNDIVDKCEKLNPDQRALWHLFTFYASEDENEALFEVANESEKNLIFLSTHLMEKVRQMYEEG
jgi:hypothetical protein